MTNKKVEDLLNRSQSIINDIREYILSNKNWVFYFLNPLVKTGKNDLLKQTIEDYPDEWEDMIDIVVHNFNGSSAEININIDNGTETPDTLKRFIYLATFEDTVERNVKLYSGKINELRIANLREQISNYKKYIADAETELNKLLKE